MESLEADWSSRNTPREQEQIATIAAYALIAFCGLFRGNKVFLVDLYGLRKYLRSSDVAHDCVIVPLLGRFKGEMGDRYHLTPLASTTSLGLPVKKWIQRLVQTKETLGRVRGPAFSDEQGNILCPRTLEMALMDKLQTVKDASPGLVPLDVDMYEDFGISRSFRRSATSTARTRGVEDKHVDLINRWRSFENARGRRPILSMHDHYSDIAILLPELLKFSLAL